MASPPTQNDPVARFMTRAALIGVAVLVAAAFAFAFPDGIGIAWPWRSACDDPKAAASQTLDEMRNAPKGSSRSRYQLRRWAIVVDQSPECFSAGLRADAELILRVKMSEKGSHNKYPSQDSQRLKRIEEELCGLSGCL